MIGQPQHTNKVADISHGDQKITKEFAKKRKNKSHELTVPEKYKFFLKATYKTGDSFCRQSSLHGAQYIAQYDDPDLHEKTSNCIKLAIRIIWAILCVFSTGCCIYMMYLIYDRYKTTPSVTTIETSTYPIYMVPFPAVTICNLNKVYAPNTKNITNLLLSQGVSNDSITEFYKKLAVLVTPEYIDGVYLQIYIILESLGYDSEKLMLELSQPCEKMLKTCLWLGKEKPCIKLFRLIETSEGFCCSFNFRAIKEEFDVFDLYNISSSTNPQYYVMGSGQSTGLSVLLDAEQDSYLAVTRNFFGIEVLIHDSEEMPPNVVSGIVQPEQDLSLAIAPVIVLSQRDIRDIPLSIRMCYFEDEKKLRTVNTYSFQSCMWECKLDTILEKCSCIPFYYPESSLESFSKVYRQCSLRDSKCLRDNRYIFSSLQPPANTTGFNSSDSGMKCKCFPNCSEREYLVSNLMGQRLGAKLSSPVFGDVDMKNYASLHVYFKDLTCIQYRKDIYMTWDGLFSSVGGIFGLCLGGSILSIAEIFYFFIFKLIMILRTHTYTSLMTLGKTETDKVKEANKNNTTSTIAMVESAPKYKGKMKNLRDRQKHFFW